MALNFVVRAKRSGLAALGLLALATSLIAPQIAVAKEEVGPFGLSRNGVVTGVFGTTTRNYQDGSKTKQWDGKQFYVNFEGGLFGKVSPLGNLGGLELLAAMGYDGATPDGADSNPRGPLLGGFLYDFAVGFPVTLFHQFTDGKDRFQLQLSPGFGISHIHAYLYVKTKAAYQITPDIAAEVQWQWWPGPTSVMWNSGFGVNQQSVKGSVYLGRAGSTGLAVFAEYLTSETEEEKPGLPVSGAFGGKNPFTRTERSDYEKTLRLGVGAAF